MVDQEKKKKKLTLGGGKLSLGNKSLRSSLVMPNKNTQVVVEVNKARNNAPLKLSLDSSNAPRNDRLDKDHADRRLEALKRLQQNQHLNEDKSVSSLSKIAAMNKEREEERKAKEEAVLSAKQESKDTPPVASDVNIKQVKKDLPKKTAVSKAPEEEKEEKVVHKPKISEPKKLKKSDILHMLDDDSGDGRNRARSLASLKRAREKERRKNSGIDGRNEKIYREVTVPEVITVGELANGMSERAVDVIRELMKLGIMATSTQSIDADTAELVATSLGHKIKRTKESDVENILEQEDSEDQQVSRAPIVTVMGHVDHGKTSLLDALKSTDVVSGEAGGITQHIGAYTVTMENGKMITFIDTPGHAAFTAMRNRGAQVTDIVVLVVAADDGIKEQTIEAINHAKAANVPIIVAINKIDKPEADIDRVKNELLNHNLIPEDFGGDIMTVGVSAKQRENLDKLEEAILLLAEMQDLKANPAGKAVGTIVESHMNPKKGVVVTSIIQKGLLKKGDIVIAGEKLGKVKNMFNDRGRTVKEAGPSLAVEIYGFDGAPMSGDVLNVVDSEKQAREIIDYRARKAKELQVTATKTSLEDMFSKALGSSNVKDLPLIIKGDTHGSIEAINSSLSKIEHSEINLKILHSAVGAISESDVSLAAASGAMIIGFNVRANSAAALLATNEKIDIRYYSVIYHLIDDVKSIVSGMLSPIIRENYIGSAEIREIFNITKVGKIAGSYVTKGLIKRGCKVRLLRDNIVIHEGSLKTLKRFKEDVKEVREGYECGIAFENYNDLQIGDQLEVFEIVEEQQTL